jgi:hypothetical protein
MQTATVGTNRDNVKRGGARNAWLAGAARVMLLALSVVAAAPLAADAQLFIATHPNPPFAVGPLFVRANITPALGPIPVDIYFSLSVPPTATAVDQDIFLLWPGAVVADRKAGAPDAALARYVAERGFDVVDEGRLPLFARNLYQAAANRTRTSEPQPGGAPYVTFVRHGGPLGLSTPATWIRIPWTPKLVNRAWMMDLKLTAEGLIKDKPGTWVEHTFWGARHRLSIGFHEVRQRAMFPMYFEHRDRVVRLSEDPAQIVVNFRDSNHLKIEELYPASAKRQLSETQDNTEMVSLFVDRSEGISPQVLTMQFGYFTGLQSWAPVLIPALFFLLGNLAGPLVREAFKYASRSVKSRFDVGRRADETGGRDRGVVLTREMLARIVPGETTYDDVLRLYGGHGEESEDLTVAGRKTLVYRGQRVVPQRRRIFSWLATVSSWAVEDHEVEIRVEHDRVVDVQARVRRTRLTSAEAGSS